MAWLPNSNVLVTGGNGFVGRYVVAELHAKGYRVAILDNGLSAGHDIEADAHYQADLREPAEIRQAVDDFQPTYVVHLAAIHYIPYCERHPLMAFTVNALGTRNLLAVLAAKPIRRVFLASTAGIYSPSQMPHAETDPGWPIDIYGFSKRAAEFITQEWAERYGISVVIGRYFNMYGWGETKPHLVPVLIDQVSRGIDEIKLGNTTARRDYVHVADNARATVALLTMDLPLSTTVNLAYGASYSATNLLNMLSQITGRRLTAVTDANRLRVNDRPNLVADMTHFYTLGLPRPSIHLYDGLSEMLKTGVGPYVEWEVA